MFQEWRSLNPSLGLDITVVDPLLVITIVAGCRHLYGILWLLRVFVIVFICLRRLRVYLDRSA